VDIVTSNGSQMNILCDVTCDTVIINFVLEAGETVISLTEWLVTDANGQSLMGLENLLTAPGSS